VWKIKNTGGKTGTAAGSRPETMKQTARVGPWRNASSRGQDSISGRQVIQGAPGRKLHLGQKRMGQAPSGTPEGAPKNNQGKLGAQQNGTDEHTGLLEKKVSKKRRRTLRPSKRVRGAGSSVGKKNTVKTTVAKVFVKTEKREWAAKPNRSKKNR